MRGPMEPRIWMATGSSTGRHTRAAVNIFNVIHTEAAHAEYGWPVSASAAVKC